MCFVVMLQGRHGMSCDSVSCSVMLRTLHHFVTYVKLLSCKQNASLTAGYVWIGARRIEDGQQDFSQYTAIFGMLGIRMGCPVQPVVLRTLLKFLWWGVVRLSHLAWTNCHQYTFKFGSLTPTAQSHLPSRVRSLQ
jgi:hypothetical protein